MNEYIVELKFPRVSRLPIYSVEVDALTRGEAELIARGIAVKDGFKVAPLKVTVTLKSKEAA